MHTMDVDMNITWNDFGETKGAHCAQDGRIVQGTT